MGNIGKLIESILVNNPIICKALLLFFSFHPFTFVHLYYYYMMKHQMIVEQSGSIEEKREK
jgi:hypothetical protein